MAKSDLMLVDREKKVVAFFNVDAHRELATSFAEEALSPSKADVGRGQ